MPSSGMPAPWRALCAAALCTVALCPVALPGQAPPAPLPRPAAQVRHGAPPPPHHEPQPQVPPLLLLDHLQRSHAAAAAARAAGQPAPAPLPRPAGAGRHLCAVLACADAGLDVPALLGLPPADVLVVATPGPFVHAETVALLEQAVAEDRLGLVLLLTHADCRALAPARPGAPAALQQRLAALHQEAPRRRLPVHRTHAELQREALLAASGSLRQAVARDALRVVPGEVAPRPGTVALHPRAADALPLAPVR